MDRSKLKLLLNTVKYLRLKQIYYQLYYLLRNKFFKKDYSKLLNKEINPLVWTDGFLNSNSFKQPNTFTFLNLEHQFETNIDWNFKEFGKLWTYNLNYFDFLHQENIAINEGLELIRDYQLHDINLKDGKEPYPISLRGINWIKFLSKNKIVDQNINQTLFNHYQRLVNNLEYHLLGNHLLENGYSLLFGAYYFKDEFLYKKAIKILTEELNEQVLDDGAHFELSPMYHQILLHRLLDCIFLVQNNLWKADALLGFLKEKATKMLSWLYEVTFKSGDIPMVNDSAYGIAPNSNQLFKYAKELGLNINRLPLKDSGYRMYRHNDYELFIDVGNVGPKYQPGHAHSDTFNFELYVKGNPVIVDTGISTYEKNAARLLERRTSSHNTVKINQQEQTQVWDGFRVANRAIIVKLQETENQLEATHNGYKKLGLFHTRKFSLNPKSIIIEDSVSKVSNLEQVANFHFHPKVKSILIENKQVVLKDENIKIAFAENNLKIEEVDYEYALGFNKRQKAKKIKVYFKTHLTTSIHLQ